VTAVLDAPSPAPLDTSWLTPDGLRDVLRFLEPVERMEMFAAIDGLTERQQTFREFVCAQKPKFQWSWHNELLVLRLQDVADGLLLRLIVNEPPRHGKSEVISRLFSAYWLYRHPETFVGLAGFGDTLVRGHSHAAQRYYEGSGGVIKPEVSAVGHWETNEDGGMWAAGVGGGIMGKGFSLGIIDDPYKSEKEAQSDAVRTAVESWFDSTFYSRQAPGAAIIILMTRWHESDLVAWLLKAEHDAEDTPEGWHVVSLDAIHDRYDFEKWKAELPKTVTVEPDPRSDGEPLWPARWDLKKLRKIRRRYGGPSGYRWRCLYQQRPSAREGGFFRVNLITIHDRVPALLKQGRGWDQGATEGCGSWDEISPDNQPNDDADWTVGVRLGLAANGDYWVTDFVMGQWEPGARDAVIRRTVKADGRAVHQRGEQEPGAGGKSSARAFRRLCAGYSCSTERADEKKEVKAEPLASIVSDGRLKLKRAPWNEVFLKWMRAFGPGVKWDDVPDAASIGYNWLSQFELRLLGADPLEDENGPDAPDE
jgi:predicted phage terminase large subunit-like protein